MKELRAEVGPREKDAVSNYVCGTLVNVLVHV